MKNLIFPILVKIRKGVYIVVYLWDKLCGNKSLISILCYHSVQNDSWRFSTSPAEFKKQIKYLASQFEFISLQDVEEFIAGKKQITKPSVVITFDDGYKNLLQTKKLLKGLGVKPTLFVIADSKNADRTELDSNIPFLSASEIKELAKAGWTIGCHSLTHPDFAHLKGEEVTEQVKNARKLLVKTLQLPIPYIAYPKGAYSRKVLSVVKNTGYRLGLSMDDGQISTATNKLIVPRIGVDRTHSFSEFKTLTSPSAVKLRGFIKKTFISKFF